MFRFQQAFIISAVFLLCLIFVTLSWLFRLSIVLPSHLFTRLTDVILQYKSIYRKNFDKKIFFIYLACIWHFYDGVRRKEQKKNTRISFRNVMFEFCASCDMPFNLSGLCQFQSNSPFGPQTSKLPSFT